MWTQPQLVFDIIYFVWLLCGLCQLCDLRTPPPSLSIFNQLLCLNMFNTCLFITSIEKAGIGETLYTRILSNRNPNVTIFVFPKFFKFLNNYNFIFKCLPKVKHIPTNNVRWDLRSHQNTIFPIFILSCTFQEWHCKRKRTPSGADLNSHWLCSPLLKW